jgi:DNA-binding NarL/FixJ family response regulator
LYAVNIKPIRILIIDDYTLIRAAPQMLIESQPGVRVVGEGVGSAEALAAAFREQPDIVLLYLDLGDANGLALLSQLNTVVLRTRVVILTGDAMLRYTVAPSVSGSYA